MARRVLMGPYDQPPSSPVTVARQVIPGRTYMISRRCSRREFLLRPDPEVESIYLYCLAEAIQRYELTLHGCTAMSNHHHAVVRDNVGNFPEFLAQLHKNIAKAMNALLDRWENFWSNEQPNAVYLVEAEDRFDKLVYVLANPVNDNLVDRASDWPGASSLGLSLSGRSIKVKRPRCFFRAGGNMPAEVTLSVERPEGFEELTDEEWAAKLLAAVREAEERARRERRAKGKQVLGRKAVLRTSRADTPQKVAPRRKVRPCIGCLNRARFVRELLSLRGFREERRIAWKRHREAETNVIFPFGTYRVRGFFVTAPPPATDLAA